MVVKLREVGNSFVMTIPNTIVAVLNLKKGMEADIQLEKDGFFVKPANIKGEITIKSLFENYSGDYIPKEVDWGERVGEEVW